MYWSRPSSTCFAHSSRRNHSPATRAHAFSIFLKILLLSTAMVSHRRDLSLFFHTSVHASPPSPRRSKNAGLLCDKAGSLRSTLGRTKKVRKNRPTTLSQASMRLLPMSMYSLSMFQVLTPLACGALQSFHESSFSLPSLPVTVVCNSETC